MWHFVGCYSLAPRVLGSLEDQVLPNVRNCRWTYSQLDSISGAASFPTWDVTLLSRLGTHLALSVTWIYFYLYTHTLTHTHQFLHSVST
jgi:hypothetical protein